MRGGEPLYIAYKVRTQARYPSVRGGEPRDELLGQNAERFAGTPNRPTAELIRQPAEFDCAPLEGLARIAAAPATDTALGACVYDALLPYLYPKRNVVEFTGGEDRQAAPSIRVLFAWNDQADAADSSG